MGATDTKAANVYYVDTRHAESLVHQMPLYSSQHVHHHLMYLENMSTVAHKHPGFSRIASRLEQQSQIRLRVDTQRVDVWSYSTLARNLRFTGCEVLMIDAEGSDTRILKSVVNHCRKNPSAWPHLIQFETMGRSDALEGKATEWPTICCLQKEGYLLVGYSYWDTHLVLRRALHTEPQLKHWALQWKCDHCASPQKYPYVTIRKGTFCRPCMTNL